MNSILTRSHIESLIKNTDWDLGNEVLYNLCRNNFNHQIDSSILSKTWLIGRAYSVALERRKINDNFKIDEFYLKSVVPTFKDSQIDKYLNNLKEYDNITIELLPSILEAHNYLTKILSKITNLNKRSFSSKYLHFHLPELFFIYDSRALAALKNIYKTYTLEIPVNDITKMNFDYEYAFFCYRCFYLKKKIENDHSIHLTNRDLDKILLYI